MIFFREDCPWNESERLYLVILLVTLDWGVKWIDFIVRDFCKSFTLLVALLSFSSKWVFPIIGNLPQCNLIYILCLVVGNPRFFWKFVEEIRLQMSLILVNVSEIFLGGMTLVCGLKNMGWPTISSIDMRGREVPIGEM